MSIKAVFLDLDETLLDNEASAALAWEKFRRSLQDQDLVFSWEELETTYQTVAYEFWVQLDSRGMGMKALDFRIQTFEETLRRLEWNRESASDWGRLYQECQIATY